MFFKKRSKRQKTVNLDIYIYKDIFSRIYQSLENSNFEEGGKFVGKITHSGNNIEIKVESYIDSGPGIDHSSTHIHPNGYYQEAFFRVLESYDPDIEHIGSWHSHHCNRLQELSSGDINGYMRSVNNPNYNLNHFFVMLITGLTNEKIYNRYFLFERNFDGFYEIDDSSIHLISGKSLIETVLQQGESISKQTRQKDMPLHRNRGYQKDRGQHYNDDNQNSFHKSKSKSRHSNDVERLKEIRAEDDLWISKNFPDAKVYQSKKDGSISWKWTLLRGTKKLEIKYQHPPQIGTKLNNTANLIIKYNQNIIANKFVYFNDNRYKKIQNHIDYVLQQTIKKEENS